MAILNKFYSDNKFSENLRMMKKYPWDIRESQINYGKKVGLLIK